MFSFVGETVMDPFLGSGTTSVCAKNLDRNSVGFEINSEYVPLIKEKFGKFHSESAMRYEMKIENQDATDLNFQCRIEALPYIFQDPHKLDKKIDPQKKSFGSRIK
jgi:site-specific DNA-methyltransferase (adenine-specific)